MAIPYIVPIGQVVGGNWQPTTGLTTVNLRVSPYAVATYTQDSALGDGMYKFNAVANGEYKVFVGGVEQTYFGVLKLGISSASEVPSGVDTVKIADGSISNTEFQRLDGVTSNIQTQITARLQHSGVTPQDVSTPITFISQFPLIDDALAEPSGQQVAYAQWVLDQVSAIVVTPYQQASKVRRIIANGTVQGNQVYISLAQCNATISTNAVVNRYRVFLEQGSSLASHYDNLFYVSAGDFKNYIDVIGDGLSTGLVLDGSASLTVNNVTSNLAIYLGVNNIPGARTLNTIQLSNVIIYAYNDLTLNNCSLTNVQIYQPIGKSIILGGTTSWIGGGCTNAVSSSASGIISIESEWNTSYTMPFDPSLAP